MKKFFLPVLFSIAGCAGLPTNNIDNTIPPTTLTLSMSKDKAATAIKKLVALNGWKMEQDTPGSGIIVADDPTRMPGWLFSYNVRYVFTIEQTENDTLVTIDGVAVMHGDNGPFVKKGRTSALKIQEEKVAKELLAQ
ncbi:MAG: hypothetical protein JNK54_06500 [Elusimicrobia bacterium]|nr:hypothetical protein [Elusimicrobiota bacterium]